MENFFCQRKYVWPEYHHTECQDWIATKLSFHTTFWLYCRNADPSLGPFLLTTLQGRYKDLLCKALTSTLTGNPKFLPLLTEEETRCKPLTPSPYLHLLDPCSSACCKSVAFRLKCFTDLGVGHKYLR